MSFDLTPHKSILTHAVSMYNRVIARDGLVFRPAFGTKAIAARFRTGIRVMAAFLRRILILIALEMEPSLVHVHRPENMARSKGKKYRAPSPTLVIFPDNRNRQLPDFFDPSPWDTPRYKAIIVRQHHTQVSLRTLYEQLTYLTNIAKDPIAKAKRLAFTLARTRQGVIIPPQDKNVTMRRWGLEPSAYYDAIGWQIVENSRIRPPPLPPFRRGPKPSITRL